MLPIRILFQPNDTTCGPTSLHAVYQYYGDSITLEQVIREVHVLEEGGTLAVMLANHALERGYHAKIYTYNLNIFDLSWNLKKPAEVKEKLRLQNAAKKSKRLAKATAAYQEFLDLGGEIVFEDLTTDLLRRHFDNRIPILTGLSATYLYNCRRETVDGRGKSVLDDVRGYPMGHFVVLSGFDEARRVVVADPWPENPFSTGSPYYSVDRRRLINSILLGIVTYDANLLIIEPKDGRA